MRLIEQLFIAASLSLLTLAGPLLEAGTWSAPVTLGKNGTYATVACNSNGDFVALWVISEGSDTYLEASIFNGSWSQPFPLTPKDQKAGNPSVAVDQSGSAIAIWTIGEDVNAVVQAATLPAGNSAWIPATNLSQAIDLTWNPPQIAVDGQGNALAVWASWNEDHSLVQGAKFDKSSNSWQPLEDLATEYADSIQLAVDPAGNGVIAWVGSTSGTVYEYIQAATLAKGQNSWSLTAAATSLDAVYYNPRLGLDKEGNALLIWHRFIPDPDAIFGAALPLGAKEWVQTGRVGWGYYAELAVDPAGNATTIWYDDFRTNLPAIYSATLPATSQAWTKPVTLSTQIPEPPPYPYPQIAVDRVGNVVGIWKNRDILQAALLPFGKTWSAPVALTSVPFNAQLALSSTGTSVIVSSGTTDEPQDVVAITGTQLFK